MFTKFIHRLTNRGNVVHQYVEKKRKDIVRSAMVSPEMSKNDVVTWNGSPVKLPINVPSVEGYFSDISTENVKPAGVLVSAVSH